MSSPNYLTSLSPSTTTSGLSMSGPVPGDKRSSRSLMGRGGVPGTEIGVSSYMYTGAPGMSTSSAGRRTSMGAPTNCNPTNKANCVGNATADKSGWTAETAKYKAALGYSYVEEVDGVALVVVMLVVLDVVEVVGMECVVEFETLCVACALEFEMLCVVCMLDFETACFVCELEVVVM